MRGKISYLDNTSFIGKTHGFITGLDGRSYWFLLTRDKVNCGDDVVFEGARDEKGYVATLVQTINHTNLC